MATEVVALPDDAVANVFRGLPLRSLAVVRCVCKAWRDVVDGRALLLPHLHRLPRTVRGVFFNYRGHGDPHYFARPCSPSTIPRVDGRLGFLPKDHSREFSVLDHCNGLLLLCGKTRLGDLCVCNPATRRWTVLPRWWRADDHRRRDRYACAYIAFDPAESPQYEVVLVPAVPKAQSPPEYYDGWAAAAEVQRPVLEKEKDAPFCLDWFFSLPDDDTAVGQCEFEQLQHDINDHMDLRGYMEWPPATWTLRVFSSSTGQWEDRAFVREGVPAGTVAKMRLDLESPYRRPPWRCAVYHHGSLYVHCRGSFVARISLSKNKYEIIQTPVEFNEYIKPYLGKLHNGVCFGIVCDHKLKIWILEESCGKMQWALKNETVVRHYDKYLASIASSASIASYNSGRRHDGSWTIEENTEIQDTDHDVEYLLEEENIEIQNTDQDVEPLEEGHEWDSDNDDTLTINNESQDFHNDKHLHIIGFHPYKEVVFMARQFQVVAYQLSSTKIQYLGNLLPKYCHVNFWNPIQESFVYTPCMIGDLLHGDQTGDQSSFED